MPPGVYVGRGRGDYGKWGNPFRGDGTAAGQAAAVDRFERERHTVGYPSDDEVRRELAGQDLICWCGLDQPCHRTVLLKVANGGLASV